MTSARNSVEYGSWSRFLAIGDYCPMRILFKSLVVLAFSHQLMGVSLVLERVNLITMVSDQVQPDMTIVIEGGRIVEIREFQAGLHKESKRVINCEGKFLIPGLWDMHVHLSYYGETAFPQTVAYGVLGVRDCGGLLSEIDHWKEEISKGERIGPTLIRCGSFLDGPKEMSDLRKGFTEIITSESQARDLVHSHKARGVDFLKVHSRLGREFFFVIAEEAKKVGIPLVAHVPQHITALEASNAGVVSIEHAESFLGASLYVEPEAELSKATDAQFEKLKGSYGQSLYEKIAANKTWVCPTRISLVRSFRDSNSLWEKNLLTNLSEVVQGLHQAGVKMVAGSDFAFTDGKIRPGLDLHGELELFVEIGMTPYEALQTATSHPAELLGLSKEWGTIEVGKLANLVLLDSDPLTEISSTRDISAVVLRGNFLDSNKLLELGYQEQDLP